jgi:hypothetical protein
MRVENCTFETVNWAETSWDVEKKRRYLVSAIENIVSNIVGLVHVLWSDAV